MIMIVIMTMILLFLIFWLLAALSILLADSGTAVGSDSLLSVLYVLPCGGGHVLVVMVMVMRRWRWSIQLILMSSWIRNDAGIMVLLFLIFSPLHATNLLIQYPRIR